MSTKDIITVIVSILSLLVALFSLISSRKSSSSASRSLVITRNQAKFSQVQAFTSPVPATLKLTSIVYENASSTEVGERANTEHDGYVVKVKGTIKNRTDQELLITFRAYSDRVFPLTTETANLKDNGYLVLSGNETVDFSCNLLVSYDNGIQLFRVLDPSGGTVKPPDEAKKFRRRKTGESCISYIKEKFFTDREDNILRWDGQLERGYGFYIAIDTRITPRLTGVWSVRLKRSPITLKNSGRKIRVAEKAPIDDDSAYYRFSYDDSLLFIRDASTARLFAPPITYVIGRS